MCIVCLIIAFASNAVLLLWDPRRRLLCTKGGSQVGEIGRNEEAAWSRRGSVKVRQRKMLWPLWRAALIRVLGPIGDGANEAAGGRENRSGGGAESKGDNDMLQCVIIS